MLICGSQIELRGLMIGHLSMNSDSQLFYSLKEIIYEIKFELTCYSLKSILSDVHQNPIRFILIKFSLHL